LTSLREKLIKIGAKVMSHARYVTFQMAEVAVPRQVFQDILSLIARLRAPLAQHDRQIGTDATDATAEVRFDHENATGSRIMGEQSGGLAPNQVERDRISLWRNLQGRRTRSNGPGIRGMSVDSKH
jgi:hypothetical protein